MAQCQSFDAAARTLTQKISSVLQVRGPLSLSWRNLSSMSVSEAATARAALEREMRGAGWSMKEASPGGVEVTLTISENLRGYLWVAEIRHGESRDIVMEESARPAATALAPSIAIDKKLLLDEEQPLLDMAQAGSAMLVLDAVGISLYVATSGVWQREQTARLPETRPWPHDLRGRILAHGGVYEAYLPGLSCQGSAAPALTMTCRDEAWWPIGSAGHTLGRARFASTRNFFDGPMTAANGSQNNLPSFYSTALWEDRGTVLWLFAGADGRTHLYNAAFETVSSWTGWGSDIAGVESECAGGSQVLATNAGDGTMADSIQAYELKAGNPHAAGDAVTFPGPVTALWPATERGVVFAVSRDLKSGRYAAFRLAIRCTH
jgi:hypothetical protein